MTAQWVNSIENIWVFIQSWCFFLSNKKFWFENNQISLKLLNIDFLSRYSNSVAQDVTSCSRRRRTRESFVSLRPLVVRAERSSSTTPHSCSSREETSQWSTREPFSKRPSMPPKLFQRWNKKGMRVCLSKCFQTNDFRYGNLIRKRLQPGKVVQKKGLLAKVDKKMHLIRAPVANKVGVKTRSAVKEKKSAEAMETNWAVGSGQFSLFIVFPLFSLLVTCYFTFTFL